MIDFNRIEDNIFIGSAPRNAVDAKRLSQQLQISAVLSLQTDQDFRQHSIDFSQLVTLYNELGIQVNRYPITDFDASDMACKLIEPVKALHVLLDQGHCVYVHCNAGICRASATVLGYLHIYRAMDLDEGLQYLRSKRPVVNPYMDAVRQAMQNFQ